MGWSNPNPEYQREYAKANREKINARRRARKPSLGQVEATQRWRDAHPEKRAEYNRTWVDRNPEKVRNKNATRRARRLGADDGFTMEDWKRILGEFNHRCAYCDQADLPLQQEHVVPLSRGGRHAVNNVVPSCGPCNMRKGSKTGMEYLLAIVGASH